MPITTNSRRLRRACRKATVALVTNTIMAVARAADAHRSSVSIPIPNGTHHEHAADLAAGYLREIGYEINTLPAPRRALDTRMWLVVSWVPSIPWRN